MKKLIFLLAIVLFVGTGSIWGQTDCSKYYPVSDGAKFEHTLYGNKMKKEGKVVYSVKVDDGDSVLYTMEMFDKNDTPFGNSTYGMKCEEDGVSIDFKSLMNGMMTERFDNMEMDITGNNIYIPNDLSVGQTLPDAEMEMTITGTPIAMKSFMRMYNRKVESKESITTPAGTFECFVISYDTDMKMGIKTTGKTKQWLAENIGMVKTEDYNKKGKLRSMSLLTAYEQ
ncbi:hypothetical protein [uncultured Allomuricauda sp.]|uniref:TapB family protein n=1 Tax=Flagellimonas sp. W118 TaxID=3410791 RepID=UPI00261A32D3|nr:hypothetical protein [uncultured Allomuricauda sp.]